ncbi:MAG: class I SAM-dependent methyltransferase [Thermodesulfobacteriota bacterium]
MVNSIYFEKGYDYEGRFGSYWYQLQEIIKITKDGIVLEIGPGSNFLRDYLTKRKIKVETLDISSSSNPKYIGSVTAIPCESNKYDCVVGFEVMEHLPFTEFRIGLQEMARVSKKWVLFSVPDVRWFLSVDVRLFSIDKSFRRILSFPRLRNRRLLPPIGPKDHHWEIGRLGMHLSKIASEIANTGLVVEKHYRIPSNPIHHMFILKK